jgi:phosphoribosylaminoimidazole-succinocarboxamide synthase
MKIGTLKEMLKETMDFSPWLQTASHFKFFHIHNKCKKWGVIVGSVKDLTVLIKPTESILGVGYFDFSDRYSVFDWGEMPDHIPGKGASLCLMAAYFFDLLNKQAINTHYICLDNDDGSYIDVDDVKQPVTRMHVKLVRKIEPTFTEKGGKRFYDYSVFTHNLRNFLVPLELIYRNGLPTGSSVFKRLKKGEVTIEDLGLDHYPQENEMLQRPIIDLSTKLEKGDKYPNWNERWKWAKDITGMNEKEIMDMRDDLIYIGNDLITQEVKRIGIVNWDGKFEFGFDPFRELMFVDALGTPDECRFTKDGIIFSKEAARQYYKKTQPDWVQEIEDAKIRSEKDRLEDWKPLVKSGPEKLDPDFLNIIAWMYQSFTNGLLEKRIFDAPTTEQTAKEYKKYLETMK